MQYKRFNRVVVDTMKPNEVYQRILDRIAAKNDIRHWIAAPFNAFGRSMATNGYCLVTTPICGNFEQRDYSVNDLYPFELNQNKTITLESLKGKLASFYKADQNCDACNGLGMVEFTFEHDGNAFEILEECPICNGEGVLKSPSNSDCDKFFKIGECAFSVERISELVYIAETVGASDIKLIHQTLPDKPSAFLIGAVEMIIAATINAKPEHIAATIV